MKNRIILLGIIIGFCVNANAQQLSIAVKSAEKIGLKANQSMQIAETQNISQKEEVVSILDEIKNTVSEIQTNLTQISSEAEILNITETLQDAESTFAAITTPNADNLNSVLTRLQVANRDFLTEGYVVVGSNYVDNNAKNYNYIRTKTYTSATGQNIEQVQYFDGLGRANENVLREITPDHKDLASITEYEGISRVKKQYLPAKINQTSGYFVDFQNVKNAANTMYADNRPYVENNYEARTFTQTGAGENYANNPSQTKLELNAASEVPYFKIFNNKLVKDGNYEANTLYKIIFTDEDGKNETKYENRLGQTVMTVKGSDNQTVYVYDDFGQLRYVLPPLAVDALDEGEIDDSNDILQKYGYIYKYDKYGNTVFKKLPGSAPIFMVYDKARRLIFTQDSLQRESDRWTYTKYDRHGRFAYSGICRTEHSHEELQESFAQILVVENKLLSGVGYTQTELFNIAYGELLTVNFYDDYDFFYLIFFADKKDKLNYEPMPYYGEKHSTAKGALTGKISFVLDNSGNYLVSAFYYDEKGQVVQSRSTNYLQGFDYQYFKYDFIGNIEKMYKQHTAENNTQTETYTYSYNKMGKLSSVSYSLNGGAFITLSHNNYDDLGRLTQKRRHNDLDTEQFEYNIKNQLTKIRSGSFSESIGYAGLYNGSISSVYSQGFSFQYKYDDLNRLAIATISSGFGEHFEYDKHGNIERLARQKDRIIIDDLQMRYNGNQLESIQENQPDHNFSGLNALKEYVQKDGDGSFEYDANGNLIKDSDRKILLIEYNVLNLPSKIVFERGVIFNVYSADAQKLMTVYITDLTQGVQPLQLSLDEVLHGGRDLDNFNATAYCGNFEYKINRDGIKDLRIHNPEGYVENGEYFYCRRDHLGNTCEVWNATQNLTVQRTQYYPSGLPMLTRSTLGIDAQPYKLNGKEYIEMDNYDVYDLGFRTYYATIGRFTQPDPLAEIAYDKSPYAYASNNFVSEIDFMGLWTCGTGGGISTGSGKSNQSTSLQQYIKDNKKDIDDNFGFDIFSPGGGGGTSGGLFGFIANGGLTCNLTIVNSDGVIIYHEDNGDNRIFMDLDGHFEKGDDLDGLTFIGYEFDNKSAYQVGHQLSFTEYIIPLQEVVCMADRKYSQEWGMMFFGYNISNFFSFFKNWTSKHYGGSADSGAFSFGSKIVMGIAEYVSPKPVNVRPANNLILIKKSIFSDDKGTHYVITTQWEDSDSSNPSSYVTKERFDTIGNEGSIIKAY